MAIERHLKNDNYDISIQLIMAASKKICISVLHCTWLSFKSSPGNASL